MATHYSPRTFLRQVPNQLLKDFFCQRGQLTGVRWELQDEKKIGQIYDRWQAMAAPNGSRSTGCFIPSTRWLARKACRRSLRKATSTV
jgi:hypothetical protein